MFLFHPKLNKVRQFFFLNVLVSQQMGGKRERERDVDGGNQAEESLM